MFVLRSDVLLDGLLSKAIPNPIRQFHYLTHSWNYLPIAGAVVDKTPVRFHTLVGHAHLVSYSVWPQGGNVGVFAVERLCSGRQVVLGFATEKFGD